MRKVILLLLTAIWGFAATASLAATQVSVAVLGDSLVAGYGLPPGEGFVPQMQAWLDAHGAGARLINAGVSGDTSAGGAARVDWTLTPQVDALIVVLGGNDMLRGIDPAVTRANLDKVLSAADTRGLPVLLAAIPGPGNYGPDYKAAFDAIYPDLAARHGALLAPNFFAGLGGNGDPAALRELMQPDGIHPNAEGVRRIVADLGPLVLELIARARG